LLAWKRKQLGLSNSWTTTQLLRIKENNGGPVDAQIARLLKRIQKQQKAEVVDKKVELGGDSHPLNEASEDIESSLVANTKAVAGEKPNKDATNGKLSDPQLMLHLMEQNIKEICEAEDGLDRVAGFLAGRCVPRSIFASSNSDSTLSLHSRTN
jgi:hypothetical protein